MFKQKKTIYPLNTIAKILCQGRIYGLLMLTLLTPPIYAEAGDPNYEGYDSSPEAHALLPSPVNTTPRKGEAPPDDPYRGPRGYAGKPPPSPPPQQSFFKTLFTGPPPKPAPPPPETVHTQVGPRKPPASPEPLLRLPIAIQPKATASLLQPTVYLIRTQGLQVHPQTQTILQLPHTLQVFLAGQCVLTAPLKNLGKPPSPIQPLAEVHPPKKNDTPYEVHRSVSTLLNQDDTLLKIRYEVGGFVLETPTFPTAQHPSLQVLQPNKFDFPLGLEN